MEWLNQFIESFGQIQDSDTYTYRDQKQVVRDYNNTNNQNSQKSSDDLKYEMKGEDPQTGESFALELQTEKGKPRNKHEEEWIKREMTVTFTSLDNKDKFVSATLGSLCGGKYSHLVEKPIEEIAVTLGNDFNAIFNYADSSIANYSDRITSEQAFRISKSIAEKNNISYLDYEKICAKLNSDHLDGFNAMLKSSNIKIAYPMQLLEKEIANNKKAEEEIRIASEKNELKKKADYYVGLFKSFKEYRLADKSALKTRISNALPLLKSEVRELVVDSLRKDSIIGDII